MSPLEFYVLQGSYVEKTNRKNGSDVPLRTVFPEKETLQPDRYMQTEAARKREVEIERARETKRGGGRERE